MLMPSLFGESLLDDFWNMEMPTVRSYTSAKNPHDLMTTDVKETENGYEIHMNLPGVKKEDVKAELKDGYLTIQASTASNQETKDNDGKYIRRERYSGSCSRSFFVGKEVTQEEIKARFEDGVLKLDIPKKEAKKVEEQKKYITIEG